MSINSPPRRPLALSVSGLELVMTAAGGLAPEKRGTFLQRVAAELARIRRPGDVDVERAVATALRGLM